MTTDTFTEAARESAASKYQGDWDAFEGDPVDDWGFSEAERRAYVAGAEWARTHLAAQEPTDAEVEAAARAIHINTIREFDDLGGLDQHALRTRARKALSAASAARRDEEKRDD